MIREYVPLDDARRVRPEALRAYAEARRWVPVPLPARPEIAVYHRPDTEMRQVILPANTALVDYAEAVAEAVRKFAAYEGRPAVDVLHDLLAPAPDAVSR